MSFSKDYILQNISVFSLVIVHLFYLTHAVRKKAVVSVLTVALLMHAIDSFCSHSCGLRFNLQFCQGSQSKTESLLT